MNSFYNGLKKLGFTSYSDYLKSSHWQHIKGRYWKRKLPKYCYICTDRHKLQLHHRTYKRLGAEWLSDLMFLCGKCHALVHKRLRDNKGDKSLTLWNIAKEVRKCFPKQPIQKNYNPFRRQIRKAKRHVASVRLHHN